MSLEERLFKSFDDQQKVEHEAREIESLIKSFDGASEKIKFFDEFGYSDTEFNNSNNSLTNKYMDNLLINNDNQNLF